MASRHTHEVLAYRVGSRSRSKKLNKMVDTIDRTIGQLRDRDEGNIPEVAKISAAHLATELNYSESEIYRNGFPQFFDRYNSVEHKRNKGLYIDIEGWVEERKEQREKIRELKNDEGE